MIPFCLNLAFSDSVNFFIRLLGSNVVFLSILGYCFEINNSDCQAINFKD